MNKEQRLEEISRLINKRGTIRVAEIVEQLQVSDMTVRRDLTELEELGVLKRIHGGARSNSAFQYKEMSHEEKHSQRIEEKRYIAQKAAALIEEGDTIFLGPGTTVELLAEEINNSVLQVITNCLPIFQILLQKKSDSFRVHLLGGEMRTITQSFVGEMTNIVLEKMHFSKMFFSSNGVKNNEVMTSSFQEAYTQKIALGRSVEKYLLIDASKIDKEDFTSFYQLTRLTALITDCQDSEKLQKISSYTEIIN
ncbi:transcriptional regulator LacR [Streptococcus macacae]|uniref:Lactose phosphotransferase system repressor n=1 Tax=Streptococcus macacae NCTC 11558 TaxID=764298 RepID=G5JWG4_9STRE|nr:transcriptional regulator LacR [Streptococcus macacae]EHJ52550.1 transcriptional regulator, DeoR family [Streptococcus macacae NCTC 11558]SUN78744.1 lactose repressor [Streptococcus macacae NCTC 11558]